MSVFTFGYQGRDPAALHQRVSALDALLLDIRYSPRSQQPGWSQQALSGRFGSSYLWCQAFGNRSYQAGVIELDNPGEGLAVVRDILTVADVVLLCVCRRYESCHRRTVAEYLRGQGIESCELSL